ncbi:hypothetical protein RR46_04430 [Papilio xuthus]|uniref:Uncharacterized protein n=1 Tax=Papilio xuthus TaxID=66420 RepID=A0A194PM07_PAPXU|nr:hypothetical protein RR46_04430 [Papilio xuthus]
MCAAHLSAVNYTNKSHTKVIDTISHVLDPHFTLMFCGRTPWRLRLLHDRVGISQDLFEKARVKERTRIYDEARTWAYGGKGAEVKGQGGGGRLLRTKLDSGQRALCNHCTRCHAASGVRSVLIASHGSYESCLNTKCTVSGASSRRLASNQGRNMADANKLRMCHN